jgi:hypothetical protein
MELGDCSKQNSGTTAKGLRLNRRGQTVTILVVTLGVLALAAAAVLLARASGPTRSVNQVLYDTEHPTVGKR